MFCTYPRWLPFSAADSVKPAAQDPASSEKELRLRQARLYIDTAIVSMMKSKLKF